jgi:hypothetical protein
MIQAALVSSYFAPLDLEADDVRDMVLESPAADRRRIDVEIGRTFIEVKGDVRKGKVWVEVIELLIGL